MKRMLFWALAVALLAPAGLLAHEGHAHKVMGTVAAVHDNQIEVKDKDGKLTTHTVDAKTKFKRGKSVAALSELKAGDRVVVTVVESKDKAGKPIVTVTQVEVGAAPVVTKQ